MYDQLTQGWSPDKIAGRIRLEGKPYDICYETTYRYVYHYGQKKLWQYLPSKGVKRRERRPRQEGHILN